MEIGECHMQRQENREHTQMQRQEYSKDLYILYKEKIVTDVETGKLRRLAHTEKRKQRRLK